MLVTSTYRMTGLYYIHWVSKLKAAYVGWLYVQNQWVTLHLWVSIFKYSLYLLLALLTESLSYNTLKGAAA